MEKLLYTVDEVSEILGLHVKTVQKFIREGRIEGQKIGRAWKVHRDALRDYTHNELTEGGWNSRESADISNDRISPESPRVSVSAVIELRQASSAEASRISNTLIAVLNGKDPAWGSSRYDFIHDPETGTARFILYGTPIFISSIMGMLEPLLEQRT